MLFPIQKQKGRLSYGNDHKQKTHIHQEKSTGKTGHNEIGSQADYKTGHSKTSWKTSCKTGSRQVDRDKTGCGKSTGRFGRANGICR